jgi:hypothetical protein
LRPAGHLQLGDYCSMVANFLVTALTKYRAATSLTTSSTVLLLFLAIKSYLAARLVPAFAGISAPVQTTLAVAGRLPGSAFFAAGLPAGFAFSAGFSMAGGRGSVIF